MTPQAVTRARNRGATWSRLQLPFGFAFMLAVSLALLVPLSPETVETSNFKNTIVAAAIAHVIGYLSYRRFDVFPGLASAGAILPTFLLAYGAALLAVVMLRLEYSRAQLLISFFSSISWYVALQLLVGRWQPYRLAIVPGGQSDRLPSIPNVSWTVLEKPTAALPPVQGVVADLRADHSEAWERYLAHCALSGLPVYHFKQVVESLTGKVEIDHLSENTLGSLNPNQLFIVLKQLVDWLGALVLLVLLSPILLVVSVLIRIDSPGPSLFRQERMGYRGRPFRVYKFRTMHDVRSRDITDEKEWAKTGDTDSRITRLGALLRRARVDELPQILNILRGEMSWIGPRPEAIPLSIWYESELPFYHYRHIVRPGITGWAQVNQGHVTELPDALEKLHFDFFYIKNFSPWLDAVIALRTLVIVVTGKGAK